jgi:serine protease Do
MLKNLMLVLVLVIASMVAAAAPSQTHVYSWSSDSHGYLGIQLQDVTKKLKEKKSLTVDKGAYVSNVVDESPADKAGIKEGDVIVKFDGKDIQDSDDLLEALRKSKRDSEVKIDVVRQSDKKTLTATIEKAPRSYGYGYGYGYSPHIVMPKMPKMPRMPRGAMHGFAFSMGFNNWNGVQVQELSRQLAEYFEVPGGRGLLVTDVEKGSEGEKAGFKAGDVIMKLDGSTVRDPSDFADAIRDAKKESDLPCDVVRKGKAVSLKWHVTRDDRDDSEGWDSDDDDDTSLND